MAKDNYESWDTASLEEERARLQVEWKKARVEIRPRILAINAVLDARLRDEELDDLLGKMSDEERATLKARLLEDE